MKEGAGGSQWEGKDGVKRLFIFRRKGPAGAGVTPRSGGYGDVTATYIRRSEIPSRIHAKHQYRQESEYGSKWCIIHSNT